jgi:hypothetical protein
VPDRLLVESGWILPDDCGCGAWAVEVSYFAVYVMVANCDRLVHVQGYLS